MAGSQAEYKDRQFLAVIGDEVNDNSLRQKHKCYWRYWEDSVTGLLLAGIGVWLSFSDVEFKADGLRQHVTPAPDSQKNFLVVDAKTDNSAIEAAFERFTTERKDIGIVLINQHVSANLPRAKRTEIS